MENKVKRIGYLPRKRVLEIIDEISKSESISRSKVVGILVEEALDARGIANFGYSNINKSNLYKSDIYKEAQKKSINLKDAEDEFVDDSGYTVSSHKTLDRSISSSDIELANKINILKESGLI
ncbi:CopG family transcriptional regulator [Prochlorococcus marinus XMU1419]|uniref:CopG family transcriptional regulator n=1 Tax=Prochlorococcus marinus TaxID=1219 RepID=UPI001ADC51AD|nr:CopG family transcriptional regulator [Prochlorococcus marinus]MBO8233664.1 CopG family transcriptional regulator [Prochlorococcus marinus XMU1419]MBW3077137.1 CopG family transcriptional regulator [Prochlorococcus marinus str. XMU1419]|tara:strand:+ start:1488 stop:1856 length:369 start_codon:yes stop_codon:yes gene_type:complete